MASIFSLNQRLYLDFTFKGKRCRERTGLPDNEQNRRKLKHYCERLEAQITLGQFDFCKTFPNSPRCDYFSNQAKREAVLLAGCPLLQEFAEQWYAEKSAEWRTSQRETVRDILDGHLLPQFGNQPLSLIDKGAILAFRAQLTQLPGRGGKLISASRVNHIMTPLRMMLTDAADRFGFISPWRNIRALKIPRSNIMPFSLEEIGDILATVRADYRPYYMVRFFTGLRSSEIHGLTWRHVDFERRQLLVYQAWVREELIPTKTDGSYRAVQMSEQVYQALQQQRHRKGSEVMVDDFVFCNRHGRPLEDRNVANRVWYPLLKLLELEKRKPYQTRHTAATLWLAAGESPEWIAKQLGHNSTQMLFRVYSRYVPNLSGRDGHAFEQMLAGFGNRTQGVMVKEGEVLINGEASHGTCH
ncbi:MAG: tyrosine-type recombinase/integrase [Aeromonas sp.]